MKLTINVTIENGKVIELDAVRDLYGRTEFVAEYDDPITVNEALAGIREELLDCKKITEVKK